MAEIFASCAGFGDWFWDFNLDHVIKFGLQRGVLGFVRMGEVLGCVLWWFWKFCNENW